MKGLIVCIFMVLAIATCHYQSTPSGPAAAAPAPRAEPKPDPDLIAVMACNAAQDAILARLKAPATAEFPDCVWSRHEYEIRVTPDAKTYFVIGHVDAQNSFGANLRRRFGVTLSKSGSSASDFQVIEAVLDE